MSLDRAYQPTKYGIIRSDSQIGKMDHDMVANLGLNMMMNQGFARNVDVYRLRFIIVLEPPNSRLVELKQPSVQLFRKLMYLARLPVEANDGFGVALARLGDMVQYLLNRRNI